MWVTLLLMDSLSADSDHLTWTNVAIGLTFILFDVGVSTTLRLGVGISLSVAALRCIGQLALVATVLQGVFEHKNPWSVAGIARESDSLLVTQNNANGENSCVKFARDRRDWYAPCINTYVRSLSITLSVVNKAARRFDYMVCCFFAQ